MSITGVSASTLNGARAASSDGVDDFGVASTPGPESLPENERFGVGFVFQSSDVRDFTSFTGTKDSNSRFGIIDSDADDNSVGEIRFILEDNGGFFLIKETDSKFVDGNTHLVVVNKLSDTDVEIYVDDMSVPRPGTTNSSGFDHTNYSTNIKQGIFARNDRGTIKANQSLDLPFIEFKESPYSQQDRLDLKQRAPGL
jgi:hypothetical protein